MQPSPCRESTSASKLSGSSMRSAEALCASASRVTGNNLMLQRASRDVKVRRWESTAHRLQLPSKKDDERWLR
jgi:hypothetical protein